MVVELVDSLDATGGLDVVGIAQLVLGNSEAAEFIVVMEGDGFLAGDQNFPEIVHVLGLLHLQADPDDGDVVAEEVSGTGEFLGRNPLGLHQLGLGRDGGVAEQIGDADLGSEGFLEPQLQPHQTQ